MDPTPTSQPRIRYWFGSMALQRNAGWKNAKNVGDQMSNATLYNPSRRGHRGPAPSYFLFEERIYEGHELVTHIPQFIHQPTSLVPPHGNPDDTTYLNFTPGCNPNTLSPTHEVDTDSSSN
eukprot:4898113-Heterocapsa_arctica.AAC.1